MLCNVKYIHHINKFIDLCYYLLNACMPLKNWSLLVHAQAPLWVRWLKYPIFICHQKRGFKVTWVKVQLRHFSRSLGQNRMSEWQFGANIKCLVGYGKNWIVQYRVGKCYELLCFMSVTRVLYFSNNLKIVCVAHKIQQNMCKIKFLKIRPFDLSLLGWSFDVRLN